jgi:hypothetical protein
MLMLPQEHDRLFAVTEAETRHALGFCSGPDATGRCPSFVPGQPLPCLGRRVIPMRGTVADGLPFRVTRGVNGLCPLAWLDR